MQIVVQHYSSTTPPEPSARTLIQEGRRLVHAATSSKGWCNVAINGLGARKQVDKASVTTSFAYAPAPPVLASQYRAEIVLREWDTSAAPCADEDYRICDLDQFESTNFEHLLRAYPESSLPSSIGLHHSHPGQTLDNAWDFLYGPPVVKKPPVHRESLENLITDVDLHWLPHPQVTHFPPPPTSVKPYSKVPPLPVPPFTTAQVEEYLNDRWARGTWIVPVQGALPINACTSATVSPLESMATPCIRESQSGGNREVVWTQHCLLQFWDFLVAVQGSGKLGPINLALELSPSEEPPFTQQAESAMHDPLASYLSMMDHIRIMVDMQYAMHVRSVLDAWSYDTGDGGTVMDTLSPIANKVRILKGATLLLLDNLGRGLFAV
ncbi:hypothetical protein PUNSTDRAFT_140830 [Punctularia strigosozonata HHB-11173 SS5]|uniref:uncharacterized protein n=1 Tax=Punctularia strigosozonata (strain HHB-11173) TaxID=741275 RepID=UPI000441712B|nr:uncharacterized protein PUNSTDRAFT_140830 [Punctularia strigosozonata HHB-11173 SS5]EIN14571.1 hypothetical protein PUNSTDRAFT_140830 [Punctularia strigosozonata HHB-11173 SS5]